MKTNFLFLSLLCFIAMSCSNSDDSNDEEQILTEEFKITIDPNTANEIVINIDNPDSRNACAGYGFTAPNTTSNGTQITDLSFAVPGVIVAQEGSIEVGETIPDEDLGPLEWGFNITINGIDYEEFSGFLNITNFDNSDWLIGDGPIIISGILNVIIIEVGETETKTILIEFENVQVSFVGGC
jgi:hypothetical protein